MTKIMASILTFYQPRRQEHRQGQDVARPHGHREADQGPDSKSAAAEILIEGERQQQPRNGVRHECTAIQDGRGVEQVKKRELCRDV